MGRNSGWGETRSRSSSNSKKGNMEIQQARHGSSIKTTTTASTTTHTKHSERFPPRNQTNLRNVSRKRSKTDRSVLLTRARPLPSHRIAPPRIHKRRSQHKGQELELGHSSEAIMRCSKGHVIPPFPQRHPSRIETRQFASQQKLAVQSG